MRTRQLGNSELELTVVGLGCWAMGSGGWEFGWGPQDDADSISTIIKAVEMGVNWIDTAAIYGLGHSEKVVGKAIKELGEKPIVATKCGISWDSSGNINRHLDRERVRKDIEASLRRLDIEPIDLYQIHWPFPDENIEQAWEEMAKLVEEGKVRFIGVSNFSVEQLERIGRIYPPASLQPPYSMVGRDIEKDLLGYCARNNIGVTVYSPMQKGLLTGKFSAERVSQLAEDDHRRRDADFQEPKLSATLKLVDDLRKIAERNDGTLGQLAIAWVLRREEVTAAIAGARRPQQIEETAPAGDWQLCDDDVVEIEELLRKREDTLGIA